MEEIRNKIIAHLEQRPAGYVFSLVELKDLATTWVLRRAVLRMVEAKEVTSLGRGYYVTRQYSQLLGRDVAVSPYHVMAAITRREGTVFLPPDIVFANLYGLTNANSVRREMQIAGRSRKLTIGGINYDLKHMPPNHWKHAISDYGPAYQALCWIGKDISRYRSFRDKFIKNIPPETLAHLNENLGTLPAWMQDVITRKNECIDDLDGRHHN